MLDELLQLQTACEREHRRLRIKWILILAAGVPLMLVWRALEIKGVLAVLGLPLIIWFAFAPILVSVLLVALITRTVQRQRFIAVLREQAPQVTEISSHLEINHLLGGDGWRVRARTMDGRGGTAWFRGTELERAQALFRQLCPNQRVAQP